MAAFNDLKPKEFERYLDQLCLRLTEQAQKKQFDKSPTFERAVREVIKELLQGLDIEVDFEPHPYVFPDVILGKYGVEVKFTTNDTWRSVANSVFESTRSQDVEHIYVIFGKMGGDPAVRWGRYDECVMHVRTSHVPRFEVEIGAKESLFSKMGVSYGEFARLPIEDRMQHIRKYARGRLKEGERLWWLEDKAEQSHSLPLQVRLYMGLSQEEKRKLRAEAAVLCPQIVKPSRSKGKYNDATIYLLTYHGVLCPQARDLFSAGSVALRGDSVRGGIYIKRALLDLEVEMIKAAYALEDALFVEYWGQAVTPEHRISEWLKRADDFADGWKPSECLFLSRP